MNRILEPLRTIDDDSILAIRDILKEIEDNPRVQDGLIGLLKKLRRHCLDNDMSASADTISRALDDRPQSTREMAVHLNVIKDDLQRMEN